MINKSFFLYTYKLFGYIKTCILSLIGIIFEMRLLIWELIFLFIYLLRTFPPHLGIFFFCVVSSFTTWCDRQQLWKAVITGDTVTRLSIPIRGRGKSPEEGQREFGRNVVKEETTQKKNYQDEGEKSAINK